MKKMHFIPALILCLTLLTSCQTNDINTIPDMPDVLEIRSERYDNNGILHVDDIPSEVIITTDEAKKGKKTEIVFAEKKI